MHSHAAAQQEAKAQTTQETCYGSLPLANKFKLILHLTGPSVFLENLVLCFVRSLADYFRTAGAVRHDVGPSLFRSLWTMGVSVITLAYS